MKTKLFLISLFAVVLAGCRTSRKDSTAVLHMTNKLDLGSYRIEQSQIKDSGPSDDSNWKAWQNFLVFSNSSIRLPLARSAVDVTGSHYGFDPSSLKLRWLKQGELLWVSWTTFYLGSGGYTHDGNVIIQVHGDHSRELFRDYIESVAKGGWSAQDLSSLEISYTDSDKTFAFTRRDTAINGGTGAPDVRNSYPFTTTFVMDDGQTGYISEVHTVDTWHYELAGDRLKFLNGNATVDLRDEAQPIEEIVKGFNVTRSALELMNPNLCGLTNATGIVLLDEKIGRYKTSFDDGLHGDLP